MIVEIVSMLVLVAIMTVMGFLIGRSSIKEIGVLNVNVKDNLMDRTFLELEYELDDICKYDRVILKVQEWQYSQEKHSS